MWFQVHTVGYKLACSAEALAMVWIVSRSVSVAPAVAVLDQRILAAVVGSWVHRFGGVGDVTVLG